MLASELDVDLAAGAKTNLAQYANVSVQGDDGVTIEPRRRNAIFINAGVTHPHPKWLDSLIEGGRLVLPLTVNVGMGVSPNLGSGVMARFMRVGSDFSAQIVTPVAIFSCIGMRDPESEQALRDAIRAGKILKMRSLRRDNHGSGETCIVHSLDICLSSVEVGAAA